MCAIFGIVGHEEASNLTYLGLHALQHRGQEGAGIISTDGTTSYVHKRQGHVGEVFNPTALQALKGTAALGHTRYSTTGGNTAENLQPLSAKCSLGWMTLAHNGNLVNAGEIVSVLQQEGSIFQGTTDTEAIVHMIARSQRKDLPTALTHVLKQVEGAYSLLVMNHEMMIAVRDPRGFRPLVMGRLKDSIVFSSETCVRLILSVRLTFVKSNPVK